MPPTAIHNGHYRYEDDANGGFDSGHLNEIRVDLLLNLLRQSKSNEWTRCAGHGSSLDRHSYGGGGANGLYGKAPPPPPPANGMSSGRNHQSAGQYYYNIPPPREQQQQQSRDGGGRIDLAQHRDQRGSAFELYKKPIEPRGHQLYMEHAAR